MVMSRREKTIGLLAALVLGALALGHFVISPYFEAMDRLEQDHQSLQAKLDDARQTLAASDASHRRWRQLRAATLQADASAAENSLLSALGGWSQDSRLALSSIRPDRTSAAHGVQEKNFQASAQGTMRSVSSFLFRLETTSLPIRVRELQITSRAEGADALTVQIRLSTIWEDTAAVRQASTGGRSQ